MTLLLGFVVLCAGWLLSGHYVPWVSFQQEWTSAVGATLIGAAALAPRGNHRVQWPWLASILLIAAAVPCVQFVAGQIKFLSDALLAVLYLAALALSIVAGATLVRLRRREFIDGLLAVFLAAGIVSTGLAATQWLQLGPIGWIADMFPGGRPYANLSQPNHLATLLAMAIAGVLWFYESRRISNPVAALAMVWLGIGLVMTQSRTGWLFVVALCIGWACMRRRVAFRTSPIAIALGVVLFIVAVASWESLSRALLLWSDPLEGRLRLGMRLLHWKALLDALSQSPWVGYGWTQVEVAAQTAALQHVTGEGMLSNSHNLLLDLLLWNGIPLGLLFIGALALWSARRLSRCRDVEQWVLLVAIGAVFIHAMLEYPHEYLYFLVPVGFMMGALDGMDSASSPRETHQVFLGLPLAAMIVMLGWVGVEYIKVEESARNMRLLMMGVGVDKVPTVPPPEVRLLDAPREFHRFWLTHARAGMSRPELDWMRDVTQRNAVPPAQLRYALAMGLNGRPAEAANTLTVLCFMHQPRRCKEAHESWSQLQSNYPQLKTVAFPEAAKLIFDDPRWR